MTKQILAVPGMSPSPLFKRTYKVVQDLDEKLTKLIHKWRFFNAGPPMKVARYDGTEICYQGIAFRGSPVQVYWNGFIEPYIENYSINVLEQTSALAIECQFSIEDSIEEAKNLLLVMIRRIYHEMSETDRILRGDGFNFPEKKDVMCHIESMSQIITEHAEIEKMKKPPSTQNVFNIENVSGKFIQLGAENTINNSELTDLVKKIALSGDDEAILLFKMILKTSILTNFLPKETHDYLTSILTQKESMSQSLKTDTIPTSHKSLKE